jgi:hypothetical protein
VVTAFVTWARASSEVAGANLSSRSRRAAEIQVEEENMAETKKGNKIVAVPGYTRKQDGKKISVSEHRRSTPETSTGKK